MLPGNEKAVSRIAPLLLVFLRDVSGTIVRSEMISKTLDGERRH
jgi:hypothetical protein